MEGAGGLGKIKFDLKLDRDMQRLLHGGGGGGGTTWNLWKNNVRVGGFGLGWEKYAPPPPLEEGPFNQSIEVSTQPRIPTPRPLDFSVTAVSQRSGSDFTTKSLCPWGGA